MLNLKEVLEAILFASGTPRKRSEIIENLPEAITKSEFDTAVAELKEKYNGDSGVMLVNFNDKLQLTTNPKFGEVVATVLTPLKEKELSKVLLEVLAIIAYKQPVTRLDIENIKGASPEYALSVLIKTNLVEVVGRKEVVGRPVLYGTTEEFLKKFQLTSIDELPDFESVLERLESLGDFNKNQVGLYREVDIDENATVTHNSDNRLAEIEKHFDTGAQVDEIMEEDEEIPDFLSGEDYQVVGDDDSKATAEDKD